MTTIKKYDREIMELPPRLETERLILKQLTLDDYDVFWELESNADVQEFFDEVATNIDTLKAKYSHDFNGGGKYKFFFLLIDKKTGQKLGAVVLRPTEAGDWVEVGYKIIKSSWGLGIGTEATKKLIEFGFYEWGVEDIMAIADPDNIGSLKIMKKMGMVFDRKVEHEGREVVRYIIHKREK